MERAKVRGVEVFQDGNVAHIDRAVSPPEMPEQLLKAIRASMFIEGEIGRPGARFFPATYLDMEPRSPEQDTCIKEYLARAVQEHYEDIMDTAVSMIEDDLKQYGKK